MTTRQEHICRDISQAITATKERCRTPDQDDYIYWCGYRDGLSKAHEIAQYTQEVNRDPLLIPKLQLGVHNTRYKGR